MKQNLVRLKTYLAIYDYTEKVRGWCDVRRGCFLHSAEHGNDNLNLKKFWQICYTCVNRRKYETFLRGKLHALKVEQG